MKFIVILPVFFFSTLVGAASRTTCNFAAFVSETDPAGLNVRAEPSTKAKILGTLPPMFKGSNNSSNLDIYVEVDVVAGENAWFQIKNARENTSLLDEIEKKPRPVFKGIGWVSGTKLTIKSQASQAYPGPKKINPLKTLEGPFDSSDDLQNFSLLSCDGEWVQVKDRRKAKPASYWLHKTCGLQETACDGLGE